MKRQIKFRAWDGDSLNYHPQAIRYDCDAEINTELSNPKFHFMQFTGLSDKNGKEIYSGDIIKDERQEVGVISDVEYGQWFMWLHEYQDFAKGMRIVVAEPTSGMQTASFLNRTQVIGNIYENPELLK